MAAMSTALTEFSDNGNSRTYSLSGHTAVSPRLVIQKRRVPVGGQVMAEMSVKTVYATTDVDGNVLPQKPSIETIISYPVNGTYTDVEAALVIHRDIIASDEYTAAASSQNWLE